jgi:hypothetical protein
MPRLCFAILSLPPVPFFKYISTTAVDVPLGDPMHAGTRRMLIVAGSPDIVSAIPAVITPEPHVSAIRRHTGAFVHGRRRSDGNHYLRKRSRRNQSKDEQDGHCNFLHGVESSRGWVALELRAPCGPLLRLLYYPLELLRCAGLLTPAVQARSPPLSAIRKRGDLSPAFC